MAISRGTYLVDVGNYLVYLAVTGSTWRIIGQVANAVGYTFA